MTWRMFTALYELHSPLHIGYHKVGNVQRTRYYIPARNVWGAVTEALTRRNFAKDVLNASPDDYKAVGDWVKEHCAFGYWFVYEENRPLSPHYENVELKYGNVSVREFERRYLGAHVTTALDAATTSAEQESLHEVEFIAPRRCDGARTQIGGWVFLDKTAQALNWKEWFGDLYIGGERRYGFGHLRYREEMSYANEQGAWLLNDGRPRVQIKANEVLLAHTLVEDVEARGQIEPLVGRETSAKSEQFGMKLTPAQICWAPGALLQKETCKETCFEITPLGVWKKV